MTVAAETRAAVRERPFLLEALRAGVVNYTAAARGLGTGEDPDAVATALRRFAEQLPARETTARRTSVSMHAGLAPDAAGDALLRVGDRGFSTGDGQFTGLLATGDVDAASLAHVLGVLGSHGVGVEAAGVAGNGLLVIVARRDGPDALRGLESALGTVPDPP